MRSPRTNAQAYKVKLRAKQVLESTTASLSDFIRMEEMKRLADAKLMPKEDVYRGTGGEVFPLASSQNHGTEFAIKNPTMVAVDASVQRIDLADKVGVFELAFDAAETVGARNATEQMLAHQMAAAHKVAMTLMARSINVIDTSHQTRLLATAARLMDTYQRAMTTLCRVQSGGRHVLTVQHVQVNQGGQALVTGVMTSKVNE